MRWGIISVSCYASDLASLSQCDQGRDHFSDRLAACMWVWSRKVEAVADTKGRQMSRRPVAFVVYDSPFRTRHSSAPTISRHKIDKKSGEKRQIWKD